MTTLNWGGLRKKLAGLIPRVMTTTKPDRAPVRTLSSMTDGLHPVPPNHRPRRPDHVVVGVGDYGDRMHFDVPGDHPLVVDLAYRASAAFGFGIGNNDQTPLNRPFTKDSPQFHFTMPRRIFKLRYVENPDNIDNHIRVMHEGRFGKANYALLLNENNQIQDLQKMGRYDFEEIAPQIHYALQRAFEAEGKIVRIDFLMGTHHIYSWTVPDAVEVSAYG